MDYRGHEPGQEELEAAGLPRVSGERLTNILAVVLGGGFFGGLAILFIAASIRDCRRETIGRGALPALSASVTIAASAPKGADLSFDVGADHCSWSGVNCIWLEIDAMRGDEVLQHLQCCGFRVKGYGSGYGMSKSRSACTLTLQQAANRFVVQTHVGEPENRLTCEGLEIVLRR